MGLFFWRARPVPVVELRGIIAGRQGALNIQGAGPLLERGFALAKAGPHKRLILAIESPGGSPVQSDLIGQFIRRRADETGVRVIAVIGDVGASGGYWIACAADEIRANPMSIVGSIGVIGGGFGVPRLLEKLDIDRRVYTAGENKSRNDPFSPEKPEDVAFTRALLTDLHGHFKDWVRSRRGTKLTRPEAELFDGSYMIGSRAAEAGLIDKLGDVDGLLREIGGAKARAAWLKPKRKTGLVMRLLGRGAEAAAAEMAEVWQARAEFRKP
ncbi:S49 family peptidase [Acidisoma cellulosilytica]|uniref:S49 family peptidase n=1 Tax=Acidisoma cellulosilyticum TaxID=2802395 RepID=A0A963Z3C4_9PROT|nr:S49 family peptidase [Acidisoma cellulosilyticum]MCB8882004.1 S49 family peptidase [Acidisoma cellulosilyticum]